MSNTKIELTDVITFLDLASNEIKRITNVRNLNSRELAPDFFIFDFLRNNENGISKCIGTLLDPNKGRHGQGDVFLKLFLKLIDRKIESYLAAEDSEALSFDQPTSRIQWENINTEDCKVTLEHITNLARRIDVHLKFTSGATIGIENKPWAEDGNTQLSHYADFLKNKSNSNAWILIYLSNFEPEEKSISKSKKAKLEKNGNFITLNYSELNQWLEECSELAQANVVKTFIDELKKYIQKNMNGERDMSMQHAIADIIIKDENFRAAQLINNSITLAKGKLIEKFSIELNNALNSEGFSLKFTENEVKSWKSGDRFCGFYINFCPNEPYQFELFFDFLKTELRRFRWGIRKSSEDIKLHYDHWTKINEVMSKSFQNFEDGVKKDGSKRIWTEKHWSLWWTYYHQSHNKIGYNNWGNSPEPWEDIINKNLINDVVKIAIEVRDVFEKEDSQSNLLKQQPC